MMAQLTVLNGPLKGSVFPLQERGIHLVGQCLYNDVQLADRALASYHCAFVLGTETDENQYLVIDLHTRAGTRVNDVSVTKAALPDGSVITLGETSMRFEAVGRKGRGPSPLPPNVAVALLDAEERRHRREEDGSQSAAGVRAEIVPLKGVAAQDRIFAGADRPVYFGRSRGADVFLSDPGASRHQCLIAYDPAPGEFVLYDLRTTNGTLVNGERVEKVTLRDRDPVQIGDHTEFVFVEAPVRARKSDELGETRDLSHATMLVRRSAKKKRRGRSVRRPVRDLRPVPEIHEDDTGFHAHVETPPPLSASRSTQKSRRRRKKQEEKSPQGSGTGKSVLPVAVGKSARGMFAEAYRTLRTNLDLTSVDGLGRCIVVTSPGPQEGKTAVAVNLGIAAAKLGMKVVLLEGDLRRSRLHRVFLVNARPGLVNYLAKGGEVNGHLKETYVKNLWVLPRGSRPSNPGELLHSSALADLIEELREEFDLIVIDTPPMLAVSDASALSPLTDGYLLVVRSGKTPREAAKMAIEQIRRVQGTVLGVVLNDTDPKRHGYAYYHYGNYEY